MCQHSFFWPCRHALFLLPGILSPTSHPCTWLTPPWPTPPWPGLCTRDISSEKFSLPYAPKGRIATVSGLACPLLYPQSLLQSEHSRICFEWIIIGGFARTFQLPQSSASSSLRYLPVLPRPCWYIFIWLHLFSLLRRRMASILHIITYMSITFQKLGKTLSHTEFHWALQTGTVFGNWGNRSSERRFKWPRITKLTCNEVTKQTKSF